MAEYSMGGGFPLWLDSGVGVSELDSWDLPDELKGALASWQTDFDKAYDPFKGWPSLELLNLHFKEATRLRTCLQRELPSNVIELDYWQTMVNGKEEPLPHSV